LGGQNLSAVGTKLRSIFEYHEVTPGNDDSGLRLVWGSGSGDYEAAYRNADTSADEDTLTA